MTVDRLVIHSCSRTHNNRGWYNQPVFQLKIESDVSEVGNRLRAALESSVWDSRIDDSGIVPHPVVVAAGYRSWSTLEKSSKLVNIGTDKQLISMTPCRAAKRSEGQGFVGIDDATVDIPWATSDACVGKSLLSVFELAIDKAGG